MTKIILDGMGGDNAPDINVDGAKRALQDFPLIEKIYLVGREETVRSSCDRWGLSGPRVEIVPAAEVVENVRLENYRLAFRGRAPGNGVATVLPEKGSYVEGVLWKITEACEKNLDFYEGFPSFYGKESIRVKNQDGVEKEVFVYMMNAPHKDVPAKPSKFYLDGILEGCKDNQIPTESVMEAVKRTRQEVKKEKNRYAR